MDFYEVINSRHSIRDFADESIPKDIMERIPAEMENPDGTHKAIKLIKLTEAGKQLDPDAEE